MATRIVDIHPHIIAKDTKRYPLAPLGGKQSVWSAERPITFEQLIELMEKAGVDKAAIVHSSTTYGFDNSYVADSIATQPKRFAGVYSIDMMAPDAPQKIDYWMKRGLAGLRLFTAGSTMEGQGDWLADPRSFPAWEHAQKLGIPMCLQMRKAGLSQLDVLLKNFPKTRVIIDHLMKPAIEDGPPYPGAQFVLELARYPNIYLKLTTNNVRDARKGKATPGTFFPAFVKAFGASRIAWGSNCPASSGTLPEMVKEAKAALACLSSSDQEWIFAKTAQSLYPVLAD